jgi:hypothetical protein
MFDVKTLYIKRKKHKKRETGRNVECKKEEMKRIKSKKNKQNKTRYMQTNTRHIL